MSKNTSRRAVRKILPHEIERDHDLLSLTGGTNMLPPDAMRKLPDFRIDAWVGEPGIPGLLPGDNYGLPHAPDAA